MSKFEIYCAIVTTFVMLYALSRLFSRVRQNSGTLARSILNYLPHTALFITYNIFIIIISCLFICGSMKPDRRGERICKTICKKKCKRENFMNYLENEKGKCTIDYKYKNKKKDNIFAQNDNYKKRDHIGWRWKESWRPYIWRNYPNIPIWLPARPSVSVSNNCIRNNYEKDYQEISANQDIGSTVNEINKCERIALGWCKNKFYPCFCYKRIKGKCLNKLV